MADAKLCETKAETYQVKNLENFENLEKSRKYFRTFSIENHIENLKKIENFEILKFTFFLIFNMISNTKCSNFFFEIFKNFEIF